MNQSPELTDAYVLCQDCGHAEPYSDAKHLGSETCPKCGGDFCGCNDCSGIAGLSDPANAADAEQVKGRAPGLSEHASSFGQTEARA
ncbi:hypothetical protein [Ectopseudomonas oleovorans]|uniref:hypothetical protein n=1 Tax=Ectopseudomonas oleovorans TaxID=301 RepID=UPI00244B5B17|nr:hypothetical protein [Pseudomonas oleovorans]MDH2198747.1 hypothetical protein [Pseudomonas oleovorans]